MYCEFAAASDACYNQINHHRQRAYFTDGESVWDAPVRDLRDEYVPVNEKTHAFWSHGALIERIEDTFEEVGVDWSEESEEASSSTCPACGSEHVERDGDAFECLECGYLGHSDVVGAANLLMEHTGVSSSDVGLMAQLAGHDAGRAWRGDISVTHLKWNDHAWTPSRTSDREHDGHSTNEESANPQVHSAR